MIYYLILCHIIFYHVIHVYTYIYIYVYVCVYIYIYIYIHIHIRIVAHPDVGAVRGVVAKDEQGRHAERHQ